MDRISPAILNEAKAFFEVGKNQYESTMPKIINNPNECFYYIIPAIVNLSFSIELYFKGFQNETRGHHLNELYNTLPDWVKEIIIKSFVNHYKLITQNEFQEPQFLSLLNKNSNAFMEWRYFYEDTTASNADITFLYVLATTMNDISDVILKAFSKKRE